MRILVVSNLYPPDVLGGYELLARDLVEGLRAHGHHVEVLTTGAPRAEDPPWVHRELALLRAFDEPARLDRLRHVVAGPTQRRAVRRAIEAVRPAAAVLMSLRRLGLHAPRELRAAGVPTVACINDDWLVAHRPTASRSRLRAAFWSVVEQPALGARPWAGPLADDAVYVSEALRQALSHAGAPLPTGSVCPQGVDTGLFAPSAGSDPPAELRLLCVGRLHPTKGVDLALRALGHLREDGVAASLTVVGDGPAGERQRLSALARDLELTGSVDFRGYVRRPELPRVYRAHDVFLFPSAWEEPAGLTYLEAMACGLPVVAMARGGARESLRDGVNCLTVDGARGLATGVARVAGSSALRAALVEGGLSTVRESNTLDGYVRHVEGRLVQAAARGAGPARALLGA